MKVYLAHMGNPYIRYHDGYWTYIKREGNYWKEIPNLKSAARECLSYIERNDLGPGNWSGGNIVEVNGVQIARVSFKGRIFDDNKFPISS